MRRLWTLLSRLSLADGRAQRDTALERTAAANAAFLDAAREALIRVCRRKAAPTLTVDDVWRELATDEIIPSSTDKRAIGALMQWGHRQGLIRPTAHFVPSTQTNNHACPRRVWEVQ